MPDLRAEAVWERERVEARAAGGVDARVGLPVVETGARFEGREVGQGHNPPPPGPAPPLGLALNLQRGPPGPGPAPGRGQPTPANVDLPIERQTLQCRILRLEQSLILRSPATHLPSLHLCAPRPPPRTTTRTRRLGWACAGIARGGLRRRGRSRSWALAPCRRKFGVRIEDDEEEEEDRDADVVIKPSYPAPPSYSASSLPAHPKTDPFENQYSAFENPNDPFENPNDPFENPYAPLELMLLPLTIPGKLLFLARREVVPLEVPSVFPVDREAVRRVRREREGDDGEGGVAGDFEDGEGAGAGGRGNGDGNARWEFEGPTQGEVVEFRVARVRGLGSSPAAASSTPTTAPGMNAASSPDGLPVTPSAATTTPPTTTATATTRHPTAFNFHIPEATSKDYDTECWRMIMCGSLLGDGRGGRVYSRAEAPSDVEGEGSDSNDEFASVAFESEWQVVL